jgi:Alpha-(1->3)-arabinofuranosyltransferase
VGSVTGVSAYRGSPCDTVQASPQRGQASTIGKMLTGSVVGRAWQQLLNIRRSPAGLVRTLGPIERRDERVRIGVVAAVAYIPLLLSRPGSVILDTSDAPFVDPNRAMRLAASRWNPTQGLGTVADRALDDGFPMTPWMWLFHQLHIPAWIAQRLWLGTLLFVAGMGIYSLMRALRWIGPGRVAAAIAYVASPYLLSGLGGRSVVFLAWAALPWLVADTIRSLDSPGWAAPARFALVVALVGRSNLPSLMYVLVGPVLWVLSALFATREVEWRPALRALGRMAGLSLIACAWWIIAVATDPRVALGDLAARNVADLREFAIVDIVRGVVEPNGSGNEYGLSTAFIVVSYLIPALSLTALCKVRFRNRLYVVALIVIGMVLAAGTSPVNNPQPYGRFLGRLLPTDIGSLFAPSVRAFPLVTLGLAIGFAAATRALTQFRRARPIVVETSAVLLALAAAPSLLFGQVLDAGLRLDDPIPRYWRQLATQLDAGSDRYNVLELPGLDSTTYNWGTTNSPISSSLLNRAVAVRTTEQPSELGTYDLVSAIDSQLRAGTLRPAALAPLARMLAADTIVVRNDRPGEAALARATIALLDQAPGISPRPAIGPTDQFPPPLSIYQVDRPLARVRTARAEDVVVVAGNGDGIVDLANAGVFSGDEVILYAASFDDVEELADVVQPNTRFIVTDSQRWEVQSVESFVDGVSATGSPSWPLPSFPGARTIKPVADAKPGSFTTVGYLGAKTLVAPDIQGVTSYGPGDRVALAFDQNPATAWRFGAASKIGGGARATLRFEDAVDAADIQFDQPAGSPLITSIAVTFDGFTRVLVPVRELNGQRVATFPVQQFTSVTIEVVGSEPVPVGTRLAVSELRVGNRQIEERLVLPSDFVRLAPAVRNNPLIVSLSRWRDHEAVSDPEVDLVRSFVVPSPRTFELSGWARATTDATPSTRCRDDLITIDDRPISVRVQSSGGGDLTVSGCNGLIELDAGSYTLRTGLAGGADVSIDQLVLSEDAAQAIPQTSGPTILIEDPRPTSFGGQFERTSGDMWLINSMSADPGWTAQLDRVDLDQRLLANGYASAWPMGPIDESRHFVTVRMSSQRTINIAVMLSTAALLLAAGLGCRRSQDRWIQPPSTPDSLRSINSTFVILSAVGLFSVAAGPLPGLAAGLAALGMEHRASLQRTIGWIPLPLVLGIGLVRGIHEAVSDQPTTWWGPEAVWPNGLTWIAVAIAVTTALVNSERRPARQLLV